VFDYPPLCKNKIVTEESSKGEICIDLTPKDQDMEFKYVKIWITNDGMISRIEVLDRGDMRYAFRFTDLKINQDLSDSRFTYYPPKGIKIIDLR
jgi:outer membrane lipoprotein-sorting protein